jgi:hypothetical protein
MVEFYEGMRRIEDVRELCGYCLLAVSIIDLRRGVDELDRVAFEYLLSMNPFPRSLAI